jgi:hypothetical protein
VLDVLLARQPHLAASAAALSLVEAGRVEGYVAAHAVTTLAYLLQRRVGPTRSRAVLADRPGRPRTATLEALVAALDLAPDVRALPEVADFLAQLGQAAG